MRANLSYELMEAINDKIYLDLMVHIVEKRNLNDHIYKQIIDERKVIADYLKVNGVKIYDVFKDTDGEFVEYPYAVKINGGYKEGTMRYWRSAIKYQLNKHMKKYLGGI